SRLRPLCMCRHAPASSTLLATKIVQVTTDAKASAPMTPFTTGSAARNMLQTERSCGRTDAGRLALSPVIALSDCCAQAGRADARRRQRPSGREANRPSLDFAAPHGKKTLTRMVSWPDCEAGIAGRTSTAL